MQIPSVVLDTNIVISAHISLLGLEYRVFRSSLDRDLRLFISNPVLAEYASVLCRPKFRFRPEIVIESLAQIRLNSTLVAPAATLSVSPDERDNRFLECAEAACANFLVTGNRRHFRSIWKTTRIVGARELIEGLVHFR